MIINLNNDLCDTIIDEIPLEEFHNRVQAVRNEMAKKNYEAMIIFSDHNRMVNVRWISNYRSFDGIFPSPALVFLPLKGEPILFVGSDLIPYGKDETWIKDVRGAREEFGQVLSEFEKKEKPEKIGIAGYSYMTLEFWDIIQSSIKNALLEKSNIIDHLKAIKSENEIRFLKVASRLADRALEDLRDNLKEGMTEREAVRICLSSMFLHGADCQAFDMMVQSGENSAKYFLARPRNKIIKKGELLLVDVGCRYHNYASDMARGIAFGKVNKEQERLLKVTYEAWKAGLQGLKPGLPSTEADKFINPILEDAGYLHAHGEGRSCGHGTGMDPEEEIPAMGSKDIILAENMSVSYEITVQIPGIGGSRVEDVVIIRKDGPEFLTHFPHECFWD